MYLVLLFCGVVFAASQRRPQHIIMETQHVTIKSRQIITNPYHIMAKLHLINNVATVHLASQQTSFGVRLSRIDFSPTDEEPVTNP